MNTNAVCPISDKVINENTARFNAFITSVFLVIYLVTANLLPVVILLIDFFLRAARLAKLSPFAVISTQIISLFKIKNKPVNAGPKIFAAGIGVLFNIAIITFTLLNLNTIAIIFAAIFLFCALLEASVSFCVACKIYPFVYSLSNLFRKIQIN